MLTDTRIIARQSASAGAIEVLGQRFEVMFRDGMAVQLHPVQAHGQPLAMLRALELPGCNLALVDLSRLVHTLGAELRTCPPRDVPGLVFYTLRQAYPTSALFVAAVERHACGNWWAVGDGFVWQAAARAVDRQVLAVTGMAVASHMGMLASRQADSGCPA